MGMTSADQDYLLYHEMRSEGKSHEECAEVFRRCGIDIEHILRLSPAQRHFGENWKLHWLIYGATIALVGLLSFLLN